MLILRLLKTLTNEIALFLHVLTLIQFLWENWEMKHDRVQWLPLEHEIQQTVVRTLGCPYFILERYKGINRILVVSLVPTSKKINFPLEPR